MSERGKTPPYYIVGLPEDPEEAGEASEARIKFERLSADLCKVYPFIEEIRAVVKSRKVSQTHLRYEVSVEVITPRDTHAFKETGYHLTTIFEAMAPKMKRLLSSKQSRVTASHGETPRKGLK